MLVAQAVSTELAPVSVRTLLCQRLRQAQGCCQVSRLCLAQDPPVRFNLSCCVDLTVMRFTHGQVMDAASERTNLRGCPEGHQSEECTFVRTWR